MSAVICAETLASSSTCWLTGRSSEALTAGRPGGNARLPAVDRSPLTEQCRCRALASVTFAVFQRCSEVAAAVCDTRSVPAAAGADSPSSRRQVAPPPRRRRRGAHGNVTSSRTAACCRTTSAGETRPTRFRCAARGGIRRTRRHRRAEVETDLQTRQPANCYCPRCDFRIQNNLVWSAVNNKAKVASS